MYCNFTKCQAIPFSIRASSQQQKCFLQLYINPKTPQFVRSSNPENLLCCSRVTTVRTASFGFTEKTHEYNQLLGRTHRHTSVDFNQQQFGKNAKRGCFSTFHSNRRNFSTSYSRKVVKGSASQSSLPWLAENKDKEVEDSEKSATTKRSSWEVSAERFSKNGVTNRGREKVRRKDFKHKSRNPEDESTPKKVFRSSWEESAKKFVKPDAENKERGRRFSERNDYRERTRTPKDDSDIESEEIDKPNWYEIKDRFDSYDKMADEQTTNEFRRYNRQDNWGKKVWKEATESNVPKMVGESVYGVGPVLAALSANRREFYYLYVQEGIDLSGNNKKKKDKKGFERVLKLAEKLGLPKKEISKHDLNMIVDSRPHQGLVLDASPLEMVNIRELDREEEGCCPLWLALDEVMDPQNLGAIIRSSYFFGASGVVLCAKNSAPLSGVVSKASAGSLELTELRSCKNMMQFLVSSAENGWRVLGGSVSSRAVDIKEVKTGEPTILVLGSEGTGLRPLVERSCTQLVKIPGNIPVHVSAGLEDVETEEFQSFLAVESLNVSVAAGVLLHHLVGTNNSKTSLDVEG